MIIALMSECNQPNNEVESSYGETRNAATETERNIYRCGDSMMAAFKRKDYKKFTSYQHPNMTKMMGGPEPFASFIDLQMKQLPKAVVKDIRFGKILQVVKTERDMQCLVEQNLQMEAEGLNLDRTTYLVGESLDGGKIWTFFDATVKSRLLPKDIKPDISPELKIPAK